MTGNDNYIMVSRLTLILMVLLAITIFAAGPACAALACNACHTMPPLDSPLPEGERLPATGAFRGNHQGHSSNSTASCIPCHGADVSSYNSAHSAPPAGSGSRPVIRLAQALNNYSIGHNMASYNRGTFFNQTTVPPSPLGTCSNVNCHFENITPTWGATNFTAPTDCDKCHGAPPNGASAGAAGSHAKHDQYYAGTTNCQKCHPNNTNFQHATSAGNRPLNISFAAAPNSGSGSYSGLRNDYLPSQNNTYGNCTATYCHSPGNKSIAPFNAPIQVATWNNGPLGCGGCHNTTPNTGSHVNHVATTYGLPVACYKCHDVTVTSGMAISSTANHVNKKVDIAFSSTTTAVLGKYSGRLTPMQKNPSPGTAYANCDNVYCHSNAQGAGGTGSPTYSSPKWGVPATGKCPSCHKAGVHTADLITSGSHTKHLLFDFAGARSANMCGSCHWGAGFVSPSCTQCHLGGGKLATLHVNHQVDVSFVTMFGGAYSGTPGPGDGYGSCATSYCHSDGKATPSTYTNPTWGSPATGACGTCHGVTAAAPPASTPHVKHMGAGNQYHYACAECHSGKVQVTTSSTTAPAFTNLTSHVNKLRDVKFEASNAFGTYSSAITTCRNLYCHSTGNISVAAGDLPAVYGGKVYARQGWAGTVACNSCHGRSTSNGTPDYANAGAAGSPTANSHSKHVSSSAIACVECHGKTTKNNTSIRSITPSKHVDGTNHDVYFNLSGLSPSGTYDNALKKCSATYCHGAGASLAWGGTTYCNSCHSANDGTSGGGGVNNWGTGISAHTLHVEETSLPSKYTNYSAGNLSGNTNTYRFGCASCHNPAQTAHVYGYANSTYHAQVFFGYTSPGKRPSYTYTGTAGTTDNGFVWSNGNTACTATYCHSNGAGGSGNTAVSWATVANSATNTRCKVCHNYTAASGSAIATGDHAAHVNGSTYNLSCRKCHSATTIDGSNISNKTKHVNKQINVAFNNSTTAVNGTYNGLVSPMSKAPGSSYGSCTNTYCHSKGTSIATPSTPNLTATWGGSLDATCTGCHGGDNSATTKMGTIGSTAHTKHIQTYGYGCVKCHETTVSANRSISSYASHVNQLVNIEFNNSTTAVSGTYNGSSSPMTKLPGTATGTCTNTYCHSKGTSITPSAAAPNIVPNWTSNLNATCSSCHGNDNTAAYKMGTVGSASHLKHIQTYTGFSCDYCHASTVSNSRTISTQANHVNHKVDVDFNIWVNTNATYGGSTLNSKLPGSTMTSCANTYCHSDGTYVTTGTISANTTVNWGTAGPLACNSCHGNATYGTDFRKATPLYPSGTPKGNAHALHIRTGSLSGVYMQCFNCHAGTTRNNTTIVDTTNHVNKAYSIMSVFTGFSSAFRDGDNTMNSTKITLNYNYNVSGSSCSNISCHPVGLDITTTPPTPKTRSTSTVKWNSTAVCIDCHNIDMQSTSTYHHAMRNYSATYPLQAPYSSASNGVNVYARRCTMCHVDHNIFSNDLNSSNGLGRAGNLRTDIAVAPTATSGYSNKDYIKSSGSGGICISCHTTAKAKDTTRRKNDYPANVTPAITQGQYSGSGHQYDVSAKFMSDGSAVYGNCSKCHNALLNETSVFMNATSTYQFGNHNSGVRRLQGTLDAAGGETAEEQVCYRCHSLITDDDPGGGPPKAVANKDFYGVAPMSLASQDIFDANLDFRAASATSTTNKLFFKPTAAENPVENMPNQHNTGDTFAGGTWIGRSMSPWETTTAYETKSQATNATGTNYWRMVTFTSPAVATSTTVPAGNWMINVYCRESSTSQNAKIRYMVYKWNVGGADTMGATIISKGTYATELATTAAPGAVRQIAVSVPATTLNTGEKIVVDLELDTSSSYTTSYTASFYFGSHAPSDLTLPGNVIWNYAAPAVAGYGHATQHYVGIHLPSTRNETLAYIAQNRHVECVDCHNPHATRNGLHGDYGIATGGSSTTLVNSNKNWVPNQFAGEFINIISGTGSGQTRTITSNTATTVTVPSWTAPVSGSVYRIIANTNKVSRTQRGVPGASVSYSGAWTNGSYSMVNEATYEYEICFKCHAATNATTNTLRYWNVTSASLGAARWTNIGLEFNLNNASYHPVIQPLPATGNRRLTAAALTGGWAPGEVMSCSDCHGRDTGTSATAQGPHGSTVKWLLTGTYQNWPFTSAAANGTAAGGTLLAGTGSNTVPSNNFCFNCHTWAAGGNAHVKSTNHIEPCVTCHIRVPHGGKVPRLLTGTNAPPRYKPNGNGGGGTGYYLTSARLPATGYMLKTDISCSNTCGQHPAFPVAGGSYW